MLGTCSTRQHCAKCYLLSISPWPPTRGKKLGCVPGTQGLAWQWLSQTSDFPPVSRWNFVNWGAAGVNLEKRGLCETVYEACFGGKRLWNLKSISLQISARTPSLPDRPRHRGAAQGAHSLCLAESQHRSVGRAGLGQWRGRVWVSGEGGSGSVGRVGLGQWRGQVWVSGEGGSGSVERAGWLLLHSLKMRGLHRRPCWSTQQL